jgi:protein involved in polysaccharide export with SLBB domain
MSTDLKTPSGTADAVRFPIHWHFFLVLLTLAAVLAVTGCQTGPNGPAMPAADPAGIFYSTNVLHAGDVVDISFQYSTNYNTIQRIALDGTVNMNTVGPVKAAGKTLVQLQLDLADAYKSLAKDDVITVNRVMTSVAIVYVSGAVFKPGEVELSHPLTAIEAVMAAGGFDDTRARLSDVTVLRVENGVQRAYHLNLRRVLEGREAAPFYLQPFDIVYVPVKTFNY